MALMGCVIKNEKSAIGVARSQRMTLSLGKLGLVRAHVE
jgi:hypothetical protein